MKYSFTRKSFKSAAKETILYWKDNSIRGEYFQCKMSWQIEASEAEHFGQTCPMPNDMGLRLIAVTIYWILMPVLIFKCNFCNHTNLIDESYGGPETGGHAGYCEDCGWSYHHRLY